MIYAKVNNDGYVEYTVESTFVQDGLDELDYDIGKSPGDGYSFNVNSKTWVDVRTQQQKYDEAVIVVTLKRNALLYASDWTQIPNNPLTAEQQALWATYRQELRDITSQSGYPFNVIWPTPPA